MGLKTMTAIIALCAALISGCVSSPKDYLAFRSSSSPSATMSRIANAIGECWFTDESGSFATFSYAPELNSYSGQPRVLIVDKSDPAGLPQLVVSASRVKKRTEVKLFGPLLATGLGPKITEDVQSWSSGSKAC